MPFWVLGWIEVNHELPEERGAGESLWEPFLSLGPFALCGDPVSDYLFGLAKRPEHNARFAGRGVPPDASELVQRCMADNARFIAEHGEGDFGHTYATWGEVLEALAARGAPTPDDDEVGGWGTLLYAVRALSERMFMSRNPRDQVRLIVWANW
jgi:hypothetical protein